MATDECLWQNVDLSYGWVKKKASVLTWLCENRLKKVRELNLSGWKSELGTNLQVRLSILPQMCRDGNFYKLDTFSSMLYLVQV